MAGPSRAPLGIAGFAKLTGVSRETLDRLAKYVELLNSWTRRINLVGRDTLGDVWRRHILDSAQLFPLIPREARKLVDLGSGAGLPGLVLAIMGVPEVHLIESDGRKAAFLREALRITGAPAVLHAQRIDRVPGFAADVVTARALAPLPELLAISERFLGPHTICLFLKGRKIEEELTEAAKTWHIRENRQPSLTDPSGCILRLEAIARDPRAGTARSSRS
ncbi:MAG TPA: 16S rRNA (guanine(527)-N(7))-methyltransferase RsmG [Stellaceae bacterium]|nr:16S rRNA (guanine(527)-N(7))-methyltransferase RsmG [Stellaceae bacterium]